MHSDGKSEIWVQMVVPGAAAVQAALTETPASVTLRTAYGELQVAVGHTFAGDTRRLTNGQVRR